MSIQISKKSLVGFVLTLIIILAGTMAYAAKDHDRADAKPAVRSPEIQKQVDKRQEWFKHDKFGMFIHWGIWANPAGMYKGKPHRHFTEWHQHMTGQTWGEYSQLARKFNPVKFDADQWVRMAKRAGMKYIVITSKHHDGFCIFPSDYSTYDIDDASPFDRDPLAELAGACKKHGIRLGFYYSHCVDWSHPGGYKGGERWAKERKDDPSLDWNKDREITHEDYVRGKALPQVRELLTKYGDVCLIWFDIARFGPTNEYPQAFHDLIRELQPDCLINSRIVDASDGVPRYPDLYDYYSMGDYKTSPPAGGMYWESTISMHGSYGVDHRPRAAKSWRSPDVLLRQLVKCVAHNGNYLLNIGPEGDGSLNQNTLERLESMGRWFDGNSESIYGTRACKNGKLSGFNGEVTAKSESIYLHVFDWPQDGTLTITGVPEKVATVSILNGGAVVKFEQDGTTLSLTGLPTESERPDKIGHTVIVIRYASR